MQRSGRLFIGCARSRSLASKGLPPRLHSPYRRAWRREKGKREAACTIHGRSLLFLVIIRSMLEHGEVVTGAHPVHFLRLAPLPPGLRARSYHLISLLRGERNVESSKEGVKGQTDWTGNFTHEQAESKVVFSCLWTRNVIIARRGYIRWFTKLLGLCVYQFFKLLGFVRLSSKFILRRNRKSI